MRLWRTLGMPRNFGMKQLVTDRIWFMIAWHVIDLSSEHCHWLEVAEFWPLLDFWLKLRFLAIQHLWEPSGRRRWCWLDGLLNRSSRTGPLGKIRSTLWMSWTGRMWSACTTTWFRCCPRILLSHCALSGLPIMLSEVVCHCHLLAWQFLFFGTLICFAVNCSWGLVRNILAASGRLSRNQPLDQSMSAIVSQNQNPFLLTWAPDEFFQHWPSGIQEQECDLDCSDPFWDPGRGDCGELQSRVSSNGGFHSVVELLLVRDLSFISPSLASWSPHCTFIELTVTMNDLSY